MFEPCCTGPRKVVVSCSTVEETLEVSVSSVEGTVDAENGWFEVVRHSISILWEDSEDQIRLINQECPVLRKEFLYSAYRLVEIKDSHMGKWLSQHGYKIKFSGDKLRRLSDVAVNHAKSQLSLLSLSETLGEQSLLEVDARYIGIVDLRERYPFNTGPSHQAENPRPLRELYLGECQ